MLRKRSRMVRAVFAFSAAAVLAGALGGNCTGLTVTGIPLPGGGTVDINTVTVELFNATAYPVEPRLFVDPEDDSWDVDDGANRVFLDAPIRTGEVVRLTFACAAAGAIETDHAVMLIPFHRDVESDNDPIVRRHDDFDCGDVVRFIFIDDPGEDFYTRVEVNDRFVED
jgi:hypothetical protein